jgi:hypothetical protein
MSGSKQDNGANRAGHRAINGKTDPADDSQANRGINSTLDADGPAGSDATTAVSPSPMPPPDAATPQASVADVADRATTAGITAAKAVWSQAPTLIPLLAVASYGLGRLMVDGFYEELNTTAEAAGLGYASILEPAAILTAFAVAIGTVIAMFLDAFQVIGVWLFRQRRKVFFMLGFAGLAGGVAVFTAIVRADVIIDTLVSTVLLPTFRTLVDKFGSARDRLIGENRARTDRTLMGAPSARRPIAKRAVSVILSLGILVGLFVGAHELGSHEGRQAASGKSVNISIFGFDVPSITATAVRIQPIGSSPALEQLTTDGCLLEIGSAPTTVLLYDPADKSTLTVPSDQVVVVDSNKKCPE